MEVRYDSAQKSDLWPLLARLCGTRTLRPIRVNSYQWFMLLLWHPATVIYPRSEKNIFKDIEMVPFSWHTGLRLSFNPEAASPEKPEATLNLAWVVNSVYYFVSSEGEGGC